MKKGKSKSRGRPPVHDETWSKVTVVLTNSQIVFLARAAAKARLKTGFALSRSELIRELIDQMQMWGPDDWVVECVVKKKMLRQRKS